MTDLNISLLGEYVEYNTFACIVIIRKIDGDARFLPLFIPTRFPILSGILNKRVCAKVERIEFAGRIRNDQTYQRPS